MKEELFVLQNGNRYALDLKNPSGITFEFVNNLFTDLGRITPSHTYTFELPVTANNARLLNHADDVRVNASVWKSKISVEYYVNGVNIVGKADMYLSKISKGAFSCVMTWGVYMSLQKLIEDDVPLPEIRKVMVKYGLEDNERTIDANGDLLDVAKWGDVMHYGTTEFCNTRNWLIPVYNAGVTFTSWCWRFQSDGVTKYPDFGTSNFQRSPKPVVPVYYLLNLINSIYGTTIKLGKPVNGSTYTDGGTLEDIISYGVLPLCGNELTDAQLELLGSKELCTSVTVKYFKPINREGIYCIPIPIQSQSSASVIKPDTLAGESYYRLDVAHCIDKFSKDYKLKFEMELDMFVSIPLYQGLDYTLYLVDVDAYMNGSEGLDSYVLTEIKRTGYGESNGESGVWYIYTEHEGMSLIQFESPYSPKVAFVFKDSTGLVGSVNVVTINKLIIRPLYNDFDNSHPIDVVTNLPDIGCVEFVKSLFYLIGAFPTINDNGEVVPVYWEDYKKADTAVNWSGKIIGDIADCELSPISENTFAQNNYYMSAGDDLDATEKELNDDDRYENGIKNITAKGDVLKRENEIYKFPYYAPFIRHSDFPSLNTGHTIKSWSASRDSDVPYVLNYSINESKPAYGIIKTHKTGIKSSGGNVLPNMKGDDFLSMEIVNPAFISSSYDCLQDIIEKGLVVKVQVKLDEYDIKTFDFKTKVYIEHTNMFYVVSKIKYNPSESIAECELIALRKGDFSEDETPDDPNVIVELVSISPYSSTLYIRPGGQEQFGIEATYSDGTKKDITAYCDYYFDYQMLDVDHLNGNIEMSDYVDDGEEYEVIVKYQTFTTSFNIVVSNN